MYSQSSPKVSPSRLSEPTDADYSRICESLTRAVAAAVGRAGYGMATAEDITDAVVNRPPGVQALLIDDSMLVVFQVGLQWYRKYLVVHELLVLRIGDKGTMKDVTDLLDDIADQADASAISAGTALCPQDKALARIYKRAGYEVDISPGLYKWRK